MTVGVELIAVLMLVVILKFTQLDIRKMGVTKKNLKSSLVRSCLISLGCVVALCVVKHFLNPEAPLVNWSLLDPWYPLTCVFQEFLARGFLVTTLMNITSMNKHRNHIAVITSSLLFMSLHSYYGFFFMLAAGVLSFVLGYVYLKDENIWGVSIIHYALGMVGIMLELV